MSANENYTDSQMLDFLQKEKASVGCYMHKGRNKFSVVTSESECLRRTLREAITEAMNDHKRT